MARRGAGPCWFTASGRPALSRRTRFRLAVTRRIDITCGWLCEHGLDAAAVLIWRACGLWSGRAKVRRG